MDFNARLNEFLVGERQSSSSDCSPGLRPDDTVRDQASVPLKLPYSGFSGWTEIAVRGEADLSLDLLHETAGRAAPQRGVV